MYVCMYVMYCNVMYCNGMDRNGTVWYGMVCM